MLIIIIIIIMLIITAALPVKLWGRSHPKFVG